MKRGRRISSVPKREENKKGISPVIATVLLVLIAVLLGVVVLIWALGFIHESVSKQGRSADQICSEVVLDAYYNSTHLLITNNGDIPVFQIEIRKTLEGQSDIQKDITPIDIGAASAIYVGENIQQLTVYPVLLGEAGDEKKAYTCINNPVTAS